MENHSDLSKNFIPYDLALELKELGFDEECLDYYIPNSKAISEILDSDFKIGRYNSDTNNIYGKRGLVSRPLWQQAFDWFREKYNFNSWISGRKSMGYGYTVNNVPNRFKNNILDTLESPHIYDSHKKARLYCLEKLIEIAKEQNVK